MPRRTPEPLQQYRGTTAQHAAYTGPVGEITVDTTKKTAVVHDGVTAGGHPLAKESTTITASNGVEISAGGTLGQNTTVSGVSASTSAPGVVQLNNATDSTAQNQAATPKAVSDALQAAKDYADTAGAPYTGATPISVDANTREISVADATASTKGVVSVGTNLNVTNGAVSVATASTTAKGVMQVGDNMTVNGGVVGVKPWTDYAADHTTVDPTTLQEDAIVVTDESIGYPTAVLAEIEQTLSGSPTAVPSSAAIAGAGSPLANVLSTVPSANADDVAAAHNCIYRGKDLTNVYTLDELSAKLAAGDFSDLYIGDYFTRKFTHDGSTVDVNFRIAHFNYWKYMGAVDATNGLAINGSNPNTIGQTTANHLILIPDTFLFIAQMNPTNDTTGALRGCALWATLQNTVYSELNAANCMDGHIVGHSDWLTTGVSAAADSMAGSALVGSSNASAWADELIGLCSEPMVYGGTVWSSSARDVGCKKAQLALFRLDPTWITGRAAYNWWLGAVASSTAFADADNDGIAYYYVASTSRGVRPFFLFA